MSLETKSIFLKFMKNLVQNFIYFFILVALHMLLLHLFVLGYYPLYFVLLFFISYGIYRYFKNISYLTLLTLLTVVLFFINTQIYEEMVFESYLYFNATHLKIFIDNEVLYALLLLHVIVFINLKKFDKIWDIIDKFFFRN
ncbi:hypothetical protein M947_02815 [Sulfurimonas hongkongensis]|uniref:Uncharacterized protein n=1 Tax=Sulfurimonas hongkongensis TaxID=1172190 RepID=T0JFW1_9BACT|nr:hypothetical protein [Sulfurimonas hongkongensis]EQB39970.1 hypothetical protein M947_02815 [Sulfurimonas hongkongensis]